MGLGGGRSGMEVSQDPDIADLGARIHKAESARDGWRAKGNQERYFESYFLAEALEVERERLRTQRRRSLARSEAARAKLLVNRRAPATGVACAREIARRLASRVLSMIGMWQPPRRRSETSSAR